MVGRSRKCATPAELGHDLRPYWKEASQEPDYPHIIERKQVSKDADRYPGYPYEECTVCGMTGRVGSIDRFEECEERRERESVQEPVEAD